MNIAFKFHTNSFYVNILDHIADYKEVTNLLVTHAVFLSYASTFVKLFMINIIIRNLLFLNKTMKKKNNRRGKNCYISFLILNDFG